MLGAAQQGRSEQPLEARLERCPHGIPLAVTALSDALRRRWEEEEEEEKKEEEDEEDEEEEEEEEAEEEEI